MMEIDNHGASSIRYLLCVVGTAGALIFASAASQNQAFRNIKNLTDRINSDWSDSGRFLQSGAVNKDLRLTLRDVR